VHSKVTSHTYQGASLQVVRMDAVHFSVPPVLPLEPLAFTPVQSPKQGARLCAHCVTECECEMG
jgi:hypothetical protein